jgi:hypothetical protein
MARKLTLIVLFVCSFSFFTRAQRNWRSLSIDNLVVLDFPFEFKFYEEVFQTRVAFLNGSEYTVFNTSDFNPPFDSLIDFTCISDSLLRYNNICFYPIYSNKTSVDSTIYLDYVVRDTIVIEKKLKERFVYLRFFEADNNIFCLYMSARKFDKKYFKSKEFLGSVRFLPSSKKRKKGVNSKTLGSFAQFVACLVL